MDETSERWRAVAEFEGLYEVSDHGRVRTVARWVEYSSGTRRFYPSITMRFSGHRGYARVSLRRGGRYYARSVHVLVALAFIGARPTPLHDCCHGDGDASNSHVSNLRWDTKSANALDRVRHGTDHDAAKTSCPQGHLYAGANLYRNGTARGCQACRDAHNERQRQPAGFDWRAWADERYGLIVAGARPPARRPGRKVAA